MKKFFLILSLFTFINTSYAKKPTKKTKKNCYSFFTYADEDKSKNLSFGEFDKFKKLHKKNKNKISYINLFKKIDTNSDSDISEIEYKDYCIAKNTKIKKQKKGLKTDRAKRIRREPVLPTTTKTPSILEESKTEEPVVTEPTPVVDEPSKEDMEILDSIKEGE